MSEKVGFIDLGSDVDFSSGTSEPDLASKALTGDEKQKVILLSTTLAVLMGAYWLLSSLKDAVMSAVTGVAHIPHAKMMSLVVVLGVVLVYNKLMDSFPRPRLFYIFGCLYGALFLAISLLLAHPEAGLFNTTTSSYRLLGWLSYVSIESFGSLMVQSFWAVASSSVDISFARRNFGYVVAAAQVGSILGPMLATQAEIIGIPSLYLLGAGLCFVTVWLMRTYIRRYCPTTTATTTEHEPHSIEGKKSAGVMEGVHLLMEHDYVKGIFAVSSLYMIQVAVFDFTMKVLAQQHYTALYPNDPFRAIRAFASFMGKFGMVTNSVSLLFSMFGTGAVLHHCGLTATLTVFPAVMLASTHLVWALPTLPVLFGVMILIKATNFAVLNPTKEMLYQMTSSSVQYKCRSWIETFGQRGCKAIGAVITGSLAGNTADLVNYGSIVGVGMAMFLIWCSAQVGRQFEVLALSGEKVGERKKQSSNDGV